MNTNVLQLLTRIISRLASLDDCVITKVEQMPKECDDCETWRAYVKMPDLLRADGAVVVDGGEFSITVRRTV